MKGRKKNHKNNPKTNNKMAVSTYLSINNVNQLNSPISRHKLAEWLKNYIYMCVYIYIYIYIYKTKILSYM